MSLNRLGKAGSALVVPVVVAIYCLGLSAFLFHDKFLSASVDVAHHLQLVEALRGAWTLPADSAVYLNEMYIYPNLGHRIAVLWGALGLNGLNGMALTAYAAAALVWLYLLNMARRVSSAALIAALIITLLLTPHVGMLIGQEVVDNFFYAQLVAEAFFIGSCVIGAKLVGRRPLAFALFTAGAVFVCGEVHQLGAMKLALALVAVALLQAWREFRANRQVSLPTALALISAPAMMLANPHFLAMAKISANNGAISLGPTVTPTTVAAAAALLLVLSAVFLFPQLRRAPQEDGEPIELLAVIGAATAGAALLQMVAWLLGLGSDYAVLKYTYGVVTLLIFLVSAGLGLIWGRFVAPVPDIYRGVEIIILLVGHILILRGFYDEKPRLDVPSATRVMAEVAAVAPPPSLATKLYFISSAQPALVNYMATTVVLHAPRDALTLSTLFGPAPTETPALTQILSQSRLLTPRGDGLYDVAACRQGPANGPLVTVSGQCLVAQTNVRKGIVEGRQVLYKAGAPGGAYLADGWGEPELGGAWSTAKLTKAVIPLDQLALAPVKLRLWLFAFLPTPDAKRTAVISVNGGPAVTYAFDATNPSRLIEVDVPPSTGGKQNLTLTIGAPDATSPAALGLSSDARLLGVGIEATQVVYGAAR